MVEGEQRRTTNRPDPGFGEHESPALKNLFKDKRPFPYQGAPPCRATIVFLALDANFPRTFDGRVFDQFKDYYLDPLVQIWTRHGIHHPFVTCCRRIVFHQIMAEVFGHSTLKDRLASHICFAELLDVPTFGSSTTRPERFDALLKKDHLEHIEKLILAPHRRICTFVSSTVLDKITGICRDQFGLFDELREVRF